MLATVGNGPLCTLVANGSSEIEAKKTHLLGSPDGFLSPCVTLTRDALRPVHERYCTHLPSTPAISLMDTHTYPGRGLSLSQLILALNKELKHATCSPLYVTTERSLYLLENDMLVATADSLWRQSPNLTGMLQSH